MATETSPYVVADIPVLHTPAVPNDSPNAKYDGIKPSVTILHKGHQKSPGFRPFPVDTIWERDITTPMSDGILLRGDVFRPTNSKELPAFIAFSPYGKSGDGFCALNHVEGRAGVPVEKLSGYESFEAPDPAEWTKHGYAVVNVTTRGIQGSEGHHKWHGKAEARDGYDTIEYIAQLPWSDGHIALAGNSWLASNQWFIAAEHPPHLTCILPLEGLSDVYRETLCRGGVPYLPFWSFLGNNLFNLCNNEREDVVSMIHKYPLMNGYWEDKRAKANLITVPAYVLASMSTGLHTVGSTRCFEDIPHEKKWLRMNATQEWHDLYRDDTNADLKKFLDFYMKGEENGWEKTPKVRISVIRYNQSPIENVPFNNWPIPETQHRTLWLSHEGALEAAQESIVPGTVSYQSDAPAFQEDDDPEFVEFSYTFKEKSTMIGPARAVLYMSCSDHDDMDVFVILRKADKDGNILRNYNIPLEDLVGVNDLKDVARINTLQYVGPTGILRASHRALDPNLSKPHWPAHDHTKEAKLQGSEVVKLEIGIWPSAIQFEAGEKLIFRVASHQMTLAEFEPLRGGFKTGNIGRHYLHLDRDNYQSRITVPLVDK